MRLIDADELKELFTDKGEGAWTYNVASRMYIDNAPTVEITEEQAIDKLHETGWLPLHDKEMTERPTGKWVFNVTWQDYECDKCHEWTRKRHNELPNYCPNCGARMTQGETDDNSKP